MTLSGDHAAAPASSARPDPTWRVALLDGGSLTGVGTYARHLRSGLASRGVAVTVHKPWRRELRVGPVRSGGVVTEALGRLEPPLPRAGAPDAPTLVHATMSRALHRRCDVATVHDLNPLHAGPWAASVRLRGQLRRLRGLPAVMTDSEAIRRELIEAHGFDPSRVTAVPLGIDPARFASPVDPATGLGVRPARPYDVSREPRLLVVGDYRPYKGVREAIRVAAAFPAARLVHVGPPPFDSYGRACHDEARRLLGGRFEERGYVDAAGLASCYRDADLVVFLSQLEGFGFPPLEAAACGTPSLVLDTPVAREVYGRDVTYAARWTQAFAAAQAALAAPIHGDRLAALAGRYRWEETVARVVDVYARVLGERVPV